jgi:(1->4)-alpha-D-glucan 1-alpha-D-glucosylmutase
VGALRIPISTYRIQFSLNFRYVDGRDLVPYLNALGITDLYSSPRFKARRGSPHAYDVANPLRINSELGTEEEFEELAAKLKNYGMGLLLDIVPNHMATSPENPWWMDLLENGKDSLYAHHFAVDWGRGCLKASSRDRIVLPILADLYGAVLEGRQFGLKLDENGFYVTYYDHRLPLDPKTYPMVLEHCRVTGPEVDALLKEIEDLPAGDPEKVPERHRKKDQIKRELWRLYNSDSEFKAALDDCLIEMGGTEGDERSVDLLDRILDRQSYRVGYWRIASEELNYRRFFDITDLIGVRVEQPDVFDSRHMEVLGLVKSGRVTGLRVDHIDGLRNPAAYLRRLRTTSAGDSPFYVVVEKILGSEEELPQDWEQFGTTGYDYLNYLNGLFVSPEGVKALGEIYRRFTGFDEDFARVRYTRKKQVMSDLFAGEVRALGIHLGRLAAQDRYARDLPYDSLLQALVEVTACFPIYRTYVHECRVPPRDRRFLEQALDAAEHTSGESGAHAFGFLRRVLLLDIPHYIANRREWLEFVMSWQQFTGSVMAKGFEDTACYVYNRLVSQNEVGSDPLMADLPPGPEEFHRRNLARLQHQPHALNATSTHDTKRSEDVRARINALSDIPRMWGRHVNRWREWNAPRKRQVRGRPAPDHNDEYMLYQNMLGAWPLAPDELPAFPERFKNYAQKAVREAKVHTNWLYPDEAYENALLSFIDSILAPGEGNPFLRDFLALQKRIASAGAVNSLAQTLLKIASPGVPDFYQGTELWDFSLVDPDNRRPVDFTRRGALLDAMRRAEAQDPAALIKDLCMHWQDGRIKLYLTYKALNFRRAHAALFQHGKYIGLSGDEHACGFLRRLGEHWVMAAVPRLTACLAPSRSRLLPPNIWGNAALKLPPGAPPRWRNVITGEETATHSDALRLAEAFASFPVALLTGE